MLKSTFKRLTNWHPNDGVMTPDETKALNTYLKEVLHGPQDPGSVLLGAAIDGAADVKGVEGPSHALAAAAQIDRGIGNRTQQGSGGSISFGPNGMPHVCVPFGFDDDKPEGTSGP